MKQKILVLVGVATILLGVTITAIALIPKPGPPLYVMDDKSGVEIQSGIYYDVIGLYNYGSSNVTAVVVIKTGLDATPRVSQPVTICAKCSTTVLIEEVQPPRNQSADQYPIYMTRITHPEYIHIEYLSTVLSSGGFDSYLPEIGGGIIVIGLIILIRAYQPSKRRR